MITETHVLSAIAAERRELAAVLADLPAQRWDEPTLCEGWRVREVVAHIDMPFRYSIPRVLRELVRSGGRFQRMADRCARRDAAELSIDELVTTLEQNAENRWKPPGSGYEGALSHDVIHGLDITVALGLDRMVPLDRIEIVLGGLQPKQLKYFGVDLTGVELVADDLDWRFGSGSPVRGPAQHLLMAACGRRLPPGKLRGDESARFTAD